VADLTLRIAIDRALAAYADLQVLGETIDEEWSYVNDLGDAWRERLAEVMARRGDEVLIPATARAIELAGAEIGRIADPHRAIDWLSTFPQVVLVAVGEPI